MRRLHIRRYRVILSLKILSIFILFFIPIPSGKGFDIFFGIGSLFYLLEMFINFSFDINSIIGIISILWVIGYILIFIKKR